MESIELMNREFLETRDYNSKLSFIGVIASFDSELDSSIESVDNIARELGSDYEIILTNISGERLSGSVKKEYSELYPDLHIIDGPKGNYGSGKRIAYDNSEGKFIIPFCTSISYPLEYADMIHGFLGMKLKRLFYSELPVVNRDFISQIGGWRDLSNGEDIDLFARLAINYGIFAFPTSLMKLDEARRDEMLSIRFFKVGDSGQVPAMRMLRDLIISCNYSLSDVKEFRRIGKKWKKDYMRGGMVAYLMSKFARIKPTRYSKNNLLILFDSILESVVLKEYLKISEIPVDATLELDQVYVAYLKSKSKLFNDVESSASKLFVS